MRLLALLLAAEINVFAAASLTDALRDIGAQYQTMTGDRVVFNFAGSSTLARQIEEGAPADVFLSADGLQMNRLQKGGFITNGTRTSVLSNVLVIVTPRNAPQLGPRQLRGKTLALADPRSVPAGVYAKTWLTRIGMWELVKDHIVPTENVRAALAAVEAGNVDAGIVYRTDALHAKVNISYVVAGSDRPAISYPFALVRNAPHAASARRFLAYLRSKPAMQVFKREGFLTP